MDVRLPNGVLVTNVPDDISRDELARVSIKNNIASASDFEDFFAEQRTVSGQATEFLKGVPRGFANSFLTAGEGIAELADAATNAVGMDDLIDSGEENELVRASREGRNFINEQLGSDVAYNDTWTTKFGEGIGSFASFFTPAGALRIAGLAGKVVPKLGGMGATEAAVTGTLAVGTGSGEQAQRVQAAKDRGLDVSQGEEDLAILGGAVVGLSELAPVNRLLSRVSKTADAQFRKNLSDQLKGALLTGAAEGTQEVVASIAQDAIERGIYNENLPSNESLLDDFTVGGAIGTSADLVLNAVAGRRKNLEGEITLEKEREARARRSKLIEDSAQKLTAAQSAQAAQAEPRVEPEVGARVDPSQILPPDPDQIGPTGLGAPNRIVLATDMEGNSFQAEERTKTLRSKGESKEVKYILAPEEDGTFVEKVLSVDGVQNPQLDLSINEIQAPPESFVEARPTDETAAYGRHIARTMGDNFDFEPGSFSVKQEGLDRNGMPQFRVVDSKGDNYGTNLPSYEEAVKLAGVLNDEIIDRNIINGLVTILDISDQSLSPEATRTMMLYGFRALHPDENTYTIAEVNSAAGTTIAEGFSENNYDANGKSVLKEMIALGTSPRKMTAAQRINAKRLQQGLPETTTFTVQEAKSVLGKNFGKLADKPSEIETETYTTRKLKKGRNKGNFVVVSSSGEVINSRPATALEKQQAREAGKRAPSKIKLVTMGEARKYANVLNKNKDIGLVDESVFSEKEVNISLVQSLLRSKNISSPIGSPEVRTLAELFTGVSAKGRKKISDFSPAELKVFYQKLRSLPRFDSPTNLVDLKLKPYSRAQFQQGVESAKISPAEGSIKDYIASEVGIDTSTERGQRKLDALMSDLESQGSFRKDEQIQEEVETPVLALPGPDDFQVKLQAAAEAAMDKVGLKDVGVNIGRALNNALRNAEGEIVYGVRRRLPGDDPDSTIFLGGDSDIVVETSPDQSVEGFYSPYVGQIFAAIDRLPAGMTPEQQQDYLIGIINHEQIHAMRELDLFTDKEWKLLSGIVAKRKNSNGVTYLDQARKDYSGSLPSVQIEEAVAELTKDARKDSSVVSGKPKNLLNRISDFFERLRNFLRLNGFQSFSGIVESIESGEIGGRERGETTSTTVYAPTPTSTATRTTRTGVIRTFRDAEQEAELRERIQGAAARGPSGAQPDFYDPNRQAQDDEQETAVADKASVREIKTRVPLPEEPAPVLPIGPVEQALIDLLSKHSSPTSNQLGKISGAPAPRTKKTRSGRRLKNKLDADVRPTSMSELRKMARIGLESSNNLKWYDDFGKGILSIVGDANMAEASVIFGITSQQNSPEQNLAETLHIMAVARAFNPVKQKNEFISALRNGRRPGGSKLKISGDQINRIVRLYNEGFADAGLKTSTYMQMIQDRAANIFNPFSVQDVHMARVFGFKRKKVDPKTGNVVDDSKIPTDTNYRYAQFLTSKLAEEFDLTPNQMQAALWFYAKKNLSPKKGGSPGTWESSRSKSQPEIEQLLSLEKAGYLTKDRPLTEPLLSPVKAANKIATKSVAFSNTLQNEDLLEVARLRAPKSVFSANPGNKRGYGFPNETELADVIEFNRDAVDVITDDDGQIPFIRELGLPHEIQVGFGTYEGLEPNITVRLIGGTPRQASFVSNILGDALLQDAAIMATPAFGSGSQVGVAFQKEDGSNFEVEDLAIISEAVNPEKDEYGLNFTQVTPDVIAFIDGRVYDEKITYNEKQMLPEFIESLRSKIPESIGLNMGAFYQEGDYFESKDYKRNIKQIGSEGTVPGSSDILGRLDDTLYKPFWDHYTATVKRFGFDPKEKERPRPDLDQEGREVKIEPVGDEYSLLANRFSISASQANYAVEQNELSALDASSGTMPRYSFTAAPESQYVAQNPDQSDYADPVPLDRYSRANTPDLDPEEQSLISGIVTSPPENETPGQTYMSVTGDSKLSYFLGKAKQGFINRYARLEKLNQVPQLRGNLADTSSIAAALMADRSKGILASAIKSGAISYEGGVTKVQEFVHNGKSYRGLLEVMAPLFDNQYGKSLEEIAQAYAISMRAERLRAKGIRTPVEEGDLDQINEIVDRYVNPETGESIVKEWYSAWQAYNNNTIEFLRNTGVLDEQTAEDWRDMSDYVPFYKQAEGQELGGRYPKIFSGLTAAAEFKELTGGEKAINVPLMEAITRNLSMAIEMGMKNVAQQRITRDMVKLGLAREAPRGRSGLPTVKFRVDGKTLEYIIADPLVYESMQALSDGDLTQTMIKYLGMPANLLRETVTRDPGFMLVNMLRDTLSAWTTSGSSFTPVVDTLKGFADGMDELERFGVVGGYDFTNDPKDVVKFSEREAAKKGIKMNADGGSAAIFKPFTAIWDALGNATTRSDAATRNAVYEDVLARTGNEAEAAFQALEVINFSRRGTNPLMRVITAAIPFLNARMQGLDLFYRAYTGNYTANKALSKSQAMQSAVVRSSMLAALTGFYYMLVSDDEQYKNQSDEVKDLNFIIPTASGTPVKLPIPFEVGLLFKTLPERILDATVGDTSTREARESAQRAILNTFEVNPLGIQAFAPLIEASLNHNFYTGRDIVPYYVDQNTVAGLQSNLGTSEVAKFVGNELNISPMKVDHVMYGYLGTIGAYVLDAVDHVMKSSLATGTKESVLPAKKITEYPVIKRFFAQEFGSGLQEDFYRVNREVNKIVGSINKLSREGRLDELEAMIKAKGHLYDLNKDTNYIANQLSKLRKYRKSIESADLDAETKRELLDQVREETNYILEVVPELKRQADLPAFGGRLMERISL
tara:strand:+ start:13913 stop:22288 length:8376 start_codon:yes stop_codon:yes gene_type:complete